MTEKHNSTQIRAACTALFDYTFELEIREGHEIKVNWLSSGFEKVTGYPIAQIVGSPNPWAEYIHKDDRRRIQQIMTRDIIPGEPEVNYEFRITPITGGVIWMRTNARARSGVRGNSKIVYGGSKRFAAGFTALVGQDGKIRTVDPSVEETLGIPSQLLQGIHFLALVPNYYRRETEEKFQLIRNAPSSVEFSFKITLPYKFEEGNSPVPLEARIRNLSSTFGGILVAIRDLRELTPTEEPADIWDLAAAAL